MHGFWQSGWHGRHRMAGLEETQDSEKHTFPDQKKQKANFFHSESDRLLDSRTPRRFQLRSARAPQNPDGRLSAPDKFMKSKTQGLAVLGLRPPGREASQYGDPTSYADSMGVFVQNQALPAARACKGDGRAIVASGDSIRGVGVGVGAEGERPAQPSQPTSCFFCTETGPHPKNFRSASRRGVCPGRKAGPRLPSFCLLPAFNRSTRPNRLELHRGPQSQTHV